MENTPYFAIYEQGSVCWEAHQTFEEAEDFLQMGAEADALYPIAIYDIVHKAVLWQNPEISDDLIQQQLARL